ncbi:MAG: hypothetical protein E6247_29075, partial [Klebsiella variicola]|nr:hypothetical protein [Klebsiella variicola]
PERCEKSNMDGFSSESWDCFFLPFIPNAARAHAGSFIRGIGFSFSAEVLLLARFMPVDALAQKVTRQLLNAWGCANGRTSAFIIPKAL